MSEELENLESILYEALRLPAARERAAYLEATCGIDTPLRADVDSLLRAYEGPAGVLKAPEGLLEEPADSVTEGPGTVIGRYKLLEKIGEGGMAVVYMAEQEQPIRRKVALKIIKLGMDTRRVIARFEAERQALALMDHPHIAKVLDAGATETGRPYFVMELVTGVSITEYCDRNSLSTKDRLALFLQVCQAVQHAHQKGIIHRDIKPSNVMVTHHDGRPVPRVIDFGIAKATNQKLTEKTLFTRYAHIIGTPAYMSPEQAELNDLDIDTRSDIYSLGVLLYELLTGTTPFSEEELRKAGYVEMQRVIREEEPIKPSTKLSTLGDNLTDIAQQRGCTPDLLRKAVRGDLDWIVMKSLEKDRARRYETPNALASDILRHLEHEPVLARGPGTMYHLQKLLRRHRGQVFAGFVTAVVAATMLGVLSLWNRDRLRLLEAETFQDRGILAQARAQYARSDRAGALEAIKPILESRHVGPEAKLLYAGILIDMRRSDEAAATLNNLVYERAEIAGTAHSLLARILWESESPDTEKLQKIAAHRQRAEALLPETAEAYFLRAMTAVTVKEQFASLDRALELDATHYEARRLRAYTYYASRKYEKMKDDALVMTVLRSGDPLGHSLRALAWRELDNHREAIAEYNRALALTPKDSSEYLDLCVQRSETLLRMGDYQRVCVETQSLASPPHAQDLASPPHAQDLASPPQTQKLETQDSASLQQEYHVFAALTALGDYERAEALFRQIVRRTPAARTEFQRWLKKHVFDTLAAGRSWRPPGRQPAGAAFLPMAEAEETYRELSAKGRRVIADGFGASWSPDGTKLVFSLGVRGYSGVAVFDLATRETELLTVPGTDPRWSPDGRSIAFVRDRQNLRLEDLANAEQRNEQRQLGWEEIWVMNADGTEPRRLAAGRWPSWNRDSTGVYYRSLFQSTVNNWVCSIPIAPRDVQPRQIIQSSGLYPSISPDNQCMANLVSNSLRITDLTSQAVRTEWPAPFFAVYGDVTAWSPNGREIGVAGGTASEGSLGLWIYGLDQPQATRVLGGRITMASWAPDGTKLAFCLGPPYYEIWVADLDPSIPTAEALGPGQTLEEYYQGMVALYTRRIESDPQDAYAYSERARYYGLLQDRHRAAADMRRWSAVVSGGTSRDLPQQTPTTLADLTLGEPVNIESIIPGMDHRQECVYCLSRDGLELYTDSNRPGGHGHWDLYVFKRQSASEEWGTPENLGSIVNSRVAEGHPSLSADGLTLYFVSWRPEGHGAADIYATTRPTREAPWGPPVNLGSKVNGPASDDAPWISPDGLELFFKSNRPGGYGGLDLYVARRRTTNDLWGDALNLGPLVNSPYDEADLSLSPDGLSLLFNDGESPRPGGYGMLDLWMARRPTLSAPWQMPVNLGPKVNGPGNDFYARISPDGRVLHFRRSTFGRGLENWQAPILPRGDGNSSGNADVTDQTSPAEGSAGS